MWICPLICRGSLLGHVTPLHKPSCQLTSKHRWKHILHTACAKILTFSSVLVPSRPWEIGKLTPHITMFKKEKKKKILVYVLLFWSTTTVKGFCPGLRNILPTSSEEICWVVFGKCCWRTSMCAHESTSFIAVIIAWRLSLIISFAPINSQRCYSYVFHKSRLILVFCPECLQWKCGSSNNQ